MQRNLLLGVLVVLAVVVVGALVFVEPKSATLLQTEPSSVKPIKKQKEDIAIAYQEKKHKEEKKSLPSQQKIVKKRKIDPAIKAATIDHYHTYLIQLVDENPQDRDIKLKRDPKSYVYVEGRISGREYVMRVPKAVLDRPGIKLRITDLKTKEKKEIDASFLSEAATLPIGATFKADIDFQEPSTIQTDVKLPEENPAFPTLR